MSTVDRGKQFTAKTTALVPNWRGLVRSSRHSTERHLEHGGGM